MSFLFNSVALKRSQLTFLSIEDFSYQEDLVTQAHEMKKELYVWTINDEQKLTAYLQRPVDGIITDGSSRGAKPEEKLEEEQDLL